MPAPEILTPDQLRDLLVTVIAGVKAEPVAKWRNIVGEVEKLPVAMNPRWNWRVHPKGTKAQIATIEQCVDIVKAEHPLVAGSELCDSAAHLAPAPKTRNFKEWTRASR